MAKRISSFLFATILLCTIFPSVVHAKDYTVEECKKTAKKFAMIALTKVSPVAPKRVKIETSKENPRRIIILGKIIPTAYLVAPETNKKAPPNVYVTKEVRKIFNDKPMKFLATVECPDTIDDKKKRAQYVESLASAMLAVDTYARQETLTKVFTDFVRRFTVRFMSSRDGFDRETNGSSHSGRSMKIIWSAQESFTDYTFQNLHIICDYCAYFVDAKQSSPDQLSQKEKICIEQESRRFELTVQVKGQSEEEISKFLDAKVKELNVAMYQYFRLMIQRETNDTI